MRVVPILLALATSGVAAAADPPEVPLPEPAPADAHAREVRNGWIVFGTGVGLTGAGIATLTVGRGAGDEINTEPPVVAETRSILGAALTVGGITTALVGTVKLQQAWDGGGQARRTRVGIAPAPRGAGLTLTVAR